MPKDMQKDSSGNVAQIFRPSSDPAVSPQSVDGHTPELSNYFAFRCSVDIKYKTNGGTIETYIPAGTPTGCKNHSNFHFVGGPYTIEVME